MAIRVLTSQKSQRRNLPTVSISSKLKRMTLNQYAYALLTNKLGKQPEYAQILIDDDQIGVFWIKPSEKEVEGSKKFQAASENTRNLHIGILLQEFDWKLKETARFELTWDDKVGAAKVDTSRRLDQKKS